MTREQASPTVKGDADRAAELWSPVKRSNLSEEIAARVIGYILEGRFQFGEKLPAERDLASHLDVGRPAVREALRALTVIGMVEVRPGEGAFVVNHHAEFVARAFSWAMLLDPQATGEVIEARTAIETHLAGLAAERADETVVAALDELIARLKRQAGDRTAFAATDIEFHLAIAEAARNVTLARLLGATQALLRQWIERALERPGTAKAAVAQHRAIRNAIAEHDVAGAREAMRRHVTQMGALVRNTPAGSRR
jgi:GntR family transcriptional repressor for pyruvate dehydrogenase complex